MSAKDSLGNGEGLPPKESRPPVLAGLNAAARGFADYTTHDADSLLVWFRTGGRMQRRPVELFLARRAMVSQWPCTTPQAVAVIHDAMAHVLIPPGRRAAPRDGARRASMRKCDFYWLRSLASAWLRAGILDAAYRYEIAQG